MTISAMPDTRYPHWTEAWNERVTQIDHLIIDTYNSPEYRAADGNGEKQCGIVEDKVLHWFNRQELDPAAQQEFEQVKSDPSFFKDRVKARIRELMDQGRFDIAQMSQSSHF